MIIEILTLGDELLDGRRIDTNTAWLGRQLSAIGIPPRFRQTTTDRHDDVEAAFRLALVRSDVVISTGGLGPTADDLTISALGKAVGLELEFHPEIWERIQAKFNARKMRVTESNRKQAFLPKGGVEIPNEKGTAPGCLLEVDRKLIIALPGPPEELHPQFQQTVRPELDKRLGVTARRVERIYRFVGLGESYVEEAIDRCALNQIPGGETRIAYTASFPTIDVTLSILPDQEQAQEKMLEAADQAIRRELGEYLLTIGSMTAESTVIQAFQEERLRLALAESMTGGLLAGKLIDVPGSSDVVTEGVVTYSNESKVRLLGVSEKTLESQGAVSEACALEMAIGGRDRASADVAVATTGIAGPEGATDQKPVGLTYIAWVAPGFQEVKRYQFRWDRNRNRMMAVFEALRGLIRISERIRGTRRK